MMGLELRDNKLITVAFPSFGCLASVPTCPHTFQFSESLYFYLLRYGGLTSSRSFHKRRRLTAPTATVPVAIKFSRGATDCSVT